MRVLRPSALVIVALAVLVGVMWFAADIIEPQAQSEMEMQAYRLCAECGLPRNEVDWLVGDVGDSVLSRAELVEFFVDAFESRGDAAACLPRTEAVVDAGAD